MGFAAHFSGTVSQAKAAWHGIEHLGGVFFGFALGEEPPGLLGSAFFEETHFGVG